MYYMYCTVYTVQCTTEEYLHLYFPSVEPNQALGRQHGLKLGPTRGEEAGRGWGGHSGKNRNVALGGGGEFRLGSFILYTVQCTTL